MEIFLLLVDEIDDWMGALRHLLPKLLGFVMAILLFAATGFVLIHGSYFLHGFVGATVLCALIIAFERLQNSASSWSRKLSLIAWPRRRRKVRLPPRPS